MTLDDIFNEALGLYSDKRNEVRVDAILTTNHGLPPFKFLYAAFAQWNDSAQEVGAGPSLIYVPRQGTGLFSTAPYFFSPGPARAFFSDRLTEKNAPFDSTSTDDLSLEIHMVDSNPNIIGASGRGGLGYVAKFKSDSYNASWEMVLQTNPATGVAVGAFGETFHVFGFSNFREYLLVPGTPK